MKSKLILVLLCTATLAACLTTLLRTRGELSSPENIQSQAVDSQPKPEPAPRTPPEPAPTAQTFAPAGADNPIPRLLPEQAPAIPSRVERLSELRDQFRALAAGEPKAALIAAKQLTNQVERETALLALVTEWKHGELAPPRERAWAIANYGLEAGLAMELTRTPELALLWANEMTEGQGRAALLQQTAVAMLDSDPAAAFALSEQFAPGERRDFFNAVFAGWAAKDTESALRWAQQMPDPADADSALQAIRTVAPVGIGVQLRVQDGYPVINDLVPGAPAALSGLLRQGDRIVGLAQGENPFIETRTLSLQQIVEMVRGAPGSILQLQVLPADAPPGTLPQTVSIPRGQVKFKR